MLQSSSSTLSYTYNNPTPETFITKGKNRLKQNGQLVYLSDKESFEIELFNPCNVSLMAKIYINGKLLPGGGLVLRPGQRYFLDRHLDEAKKFIFNTYEIDGADAAAVAAVASNGEIKVEFFNEKQVPIITTTPYWYRQQNGLNINHLATNSFTSGGNIFRDRTYEKSVTMDAFGSTSEFRTSAKNTTDTLRSIKSLSKQETGRIEKGESSDQKFQSVNMDFDYFPATTITWYIKPKSAEPLEPKDLKSYCSHCGKETKYKWKFCVSCGTAVAQA